MIRVSTNTLFEVGTARLGELQSGLARTTEQIASGRRILTPSDDPVAAAQALELSQAKALNTQYGVNRQSARHSLGMQEEALKSLTGLIQDVQTLTVSAGNGVLDNANRQAMAAELRGRLGDLMGVANTTDGAGNYLFSGFQTASQPFSRTASGVAYAGDQGQRMLQVGPLRQVAVNSNGSEVFQGIKTGNGLFNVEAASGNQGSGILTMGASTTGTPLTARWEVEFVSNSEYIIIDPNADPADIPVPQTYVSGQTITLGSAQIAISGSPQTGDVFAAEPVRNESVFDTLDALVTLLEQPASGDAGKAALANGLSTAGRQLANALDNTLKVRASVGASLSELDALDTQGSDRDIQISQTLAHLQDLDYTQAITDLTKKKIILEAAQQSFAQTSKLSLFNFI